eukprot:5688911-Pyramimonas_sp.AAC.1
MLQLREPRATLWPFPFPEATGDVVEATMGLCLPWQEAHKEFRTQFAGTWGFQLSDFTSLHTKLEQVIHHISTLATCAHHHEIAAEHKCPRTWAGMQEHDFTLEAPLRVLEAIVQPANVKQLSSGDCSIC